MKTAIPKTPWAEHTPDIFILKQMQIIAIIQEQWFWNSKFRSSPVWWEEVALKARAPKLRIGSNG